MLSNRHREALEQSLTALIGAVEDLGLTATLSGPLKVSVSGETPRPDETGTPTSALYGLVRPLSQDVTIKCQDGRLWWCWVWSGPSRGEYESEPIAPLEEIAEVARRLHNVVSLETPI
jgi:hypothetical protein